MASDLPEILHGSQVVMIAIDYKVNHSKKYTHKITYINKHTHKERNQQSIRQTDRYTQRQTGINIQTQIVTYKYT
jgi:hypothetical protein